MRSRGNRGEVLAEIYTDFPHRFENISEVSLSHPDRRRMAMTVENTWTHGHRQVLKFAGVDSIDAAEQLVGSWVEVESRSAVALPEGHYYDFDLVGCRVLDPAGSLLGEVKGVLHIAGNDQLVVEGPDGEFWVPARFPLCQRVDIEARQILVDLPDGLMDLNR